MDEKQRKVGERWRKYVDRKGRWRRDGRERWIGGKESEGKRRRDWKRMAGY